MKLTKAQWDVVEGFTSEHERNLKNKGGLELHIEKFWMGYF